MLRGYMQLQVKKNDKFTEWFCSKYRPGAKYIPLRIDTWGLLGYGVLPYRFEVGQLEIVSSLFHSLELSG